tara:strand:+ start:3419 stop:3991 length:573 start_codon:yes stop_codon:yes gene_type:complete
MCSPELALLATVVSAGATIQQGRIQKRQIENQEAVARYNAEVQIQDLKEQKELNEIAAKQEERERRRILEAEMSAISAYGRGLESASRNNIKSTAEELFGADVATNRFNLAVAQTSADRNIGILTTQKGMPSAGQGIMTSAYVSAFGQLVTGGASYNMTRTPSTKPTTTPTTTTSYSPTSPKYSYAQRNK